MENVVKSHDWKLCTCRLVRVIAVDVFDVRVSVHNADNICTRGEKKNKI